MIFEEQRPNALRRVVCDREENRSLDDIGSTKVASSLCASLLIPGITLATFENAVPWHMMIGLRIYVPERLIITN